jgi:hypothetical protein
MTPFSTELEEVNQSINHMIAQIDADCVLDYWSRKDEDYVNPTAPEMGYIVCDYHSAQIGHRSYGGKTLCPECGDEMIYAIDKRIISTEVLTAIGGWDANKENLRPLVVAHKAPR